MRGPYLISGYLYATNVLLPEKPFLDQQGLLPNAYWFNMLGRDDPENQGAFLLAQNCSACHTIDGLNDIRTRVKNRSEDGIFVYLSHIGEMVPFMPPFPAPRPSAGFWPGSLPPGPRPGHPQRPFPLHPFNRGGRP